MCGFCHSTFVIVPVIFTGLLSSNSAANEWCAPSWTPASSARIPTTNPNLFRRVCVAILPFLAVVFSVTVRPFPPVPPRDPRSILRVLSAGPRRLDDLLADEGDLVVGEATVMSLMSPCTSPTARVPRRTVLRDGTRDLGLGTRHARYSLEYQVPSPEYRAPTVLFLPFVRILRRRGFDDAFRRGGFDVGFLRTRGRQDVVQAVVALVARVLERPLLIGHLRQVHRERPRLRPRVRILEGDRPLDGVRSERLEALDQFQVFAGPAVGRLVREVRRF